MFKLQTSLNHAIIPENVVPKEILVGLNAVKVYWFPVTLKLANLITNSNLGTSSRIPTMGPVVMYTSCHGATILMTNCTIGSQKCTSACYHGI